MYTDVEVVGHIVGQGMTNDPNNVHAGSLRGSYKHPELLPFLSRLHVGDNEMFTTNLAEKQAKWLYERGLFDAWYVTYKVIGHGQNGNFYTVDTIIDCDDAELGIDGPLYLAAVKSTVELGVGEVSYLTCRRPGLLAAGVEVPNPRIPSLSGSGKPSGGG
jgi:prophage tail gpP-like protein